MANTTYNSSLCRLRTLWPSNKQKGKCKCRWAEDIRQPNHIVKKRLETRFGGHWHGESLSQRGKQTPKGDQQIT